MSNDLTQAAQVAREKMQEQNPGAAATKAPVRKRIPLSVPQRKLEVPPIPGYHLRWIRGTAQRLAQAEAAGFEFVSTKEVQLNNVSIGGDAKKDGNTDLGSRVSIADGGEEGGQVVRLFLMKQKMEHYLEDKKLIQDRNDSIADALTANFKSGTVGGKEAGETTADVGQRYVDPKRTRIPDLFRRKGPR